MGFQFGMYISLSLNAKGVKSHFHIVSDTTAMHRGNICNQGAANVGHCPRGFKTPVLRSFSNSAPYRWETGTRAERSNQEQREREMEEILNVDSRAANSQDQEDKHSDTKQTAAESKKKIENFPKKKKSSAKGNLLRGDPVWCRHSLCKHIHIRIQLGSTVTLR